jgi:ABC-type branched-subunit amino acid transport system substrate-binding protein
VKATLLRNAISLLLGAFFMRAAVLQAEGLTQQQRLGREIFRRGTVAEAAAGSAAIGSDGMPLPSSSFACASCHGTWGEGSREGGIDVPSLNWQRLTSAGVSAVTGRRRGPYTPQTLRRAITEGVDPAGRRLHAGMPRYAMSAERLAGLVAYLEKLGDEDDFDPGVTAKSIRIGAALPLSGPQAEAGKSIRDTLELAFAAESRRGGAYGRSIELVLEDSASDSTEAVRRLIERGRVFALAASFPAVGGDGPGKLLEKSGVPLIGPVTISPHPKDSPNPYIFYLLPSLYDQARALLDFIVERDAPRRPKLAVIYAGAALDRDVVEGLRYQAASRGLSIVEQPDSPGAAAAILAGRFDYLIYSGDGAGLARVARELEGEGTPALAAFLSTVQSGVALLPPQVAARALLAAPAFPPDTRQAEDFFAVLEAGNSPHTFLGLRTAAFAAASALVQALRSSGSRLSREGLIHTLEHFQQIETGVTAPITFGPGRRVGSAGAVILSFEPASRTFVSAGGWLTPRE